MSSYITGNYKAKLARKYVMRLGNMNREEYFETSLLKKENCIYFYKTLFIINRGALQQKLRLQFQTYIVQN